MAVILFDGFDGGVTLNNTVWQGNGSGSPAGRFGSYFGMNILSVAPWRNLASALTGGATAIGMAVSVSSSTARIIATLYRAADKTDPQCSLQINADGTVSVIRGATLSTNVLGTSVAAPFATPFSVYHYVEWEQTVSDTVGYFRVLVDGAVVLTVASGTVDSKASATNATIGCVALASVNGTAYDDFYMTDSASTLGELKVERKNPSADTATAQWTPSTGTSHFALIDESTYNSDTDYVATATVNNTDLYDLEDLSATPLSILGVRAVTVARKDDATARSVRAKIKSGGTTSNGAARVMTTTYTPQDDLWLTDPNTSAAWTASGVNALQVGIEVTV